MKKTRKQTCLQANWCTPPQEGGSLAGDPNLRRRGFWRFKQSNYPAHFAHWCPLQIHILFRQNLGLNIWGSRLLLDHYPASFKRLAWRNNTYKWLGIMMLGHSLKSKREYGLGKHGHVIKSWLQHLSAPWHSAQLNLSMLWFLICEKEIMLLPAS